MLRAALLLALCCCTILAQQPQLTVAGAVSEALGKNQQIVAARERVASAQGLRLQAGLAPNPRLYLQSEDLRAWQHPPFSFGNDTEDYGYLGQLFETGGKRRRRVEFAAANVDRADLEQLQVARQITYRVAAAYWNAAAAFRIHDLQQENAATYDQLIEFQRNRIAAGVMPEADLLRTQLERDRAGISVLAAAQESDRALIGLFREMGRTDFSPVQLTEPFDSFGALEWPAEQAVIEQRPDLVALRQGVKVSEANVALQRANGKPDIDVLAGYKRNMGLDTLYTSVQIPLTFRNRNQGAIASAEADVRTAQANLAAQEAAARAEFVAARRTYEAQLQLAQQTLPQMRARAAETTRLARAAYREGGMDLLRLLDTERTRIDTDLLYFRAVADYRQAVVALQIASGRAR